MTDSSVDILAQLCDLLRPKVVAVLAGINSRRFSDSIRCVTEIDNAIAATRQRETSSDENYLTKLYLLETYAGFLRAYIAAWEQIVGKQFPESWIALQDALDSLRLMKRFSSTRLVAISM